MPRPLRPQVENGVYHVAARGNRRSAIYVDDHDRELFLFLLRWVKDRCNWRVHEYCLMTTHYHAIVATPDANIAAGMQLLNGRYAQLFNARYGHVGHLFQGRYYSALLETEAHLLEAYRYVALNPCRARMCDTPIDYPWSSHALLARGRRPRFVDVGVVLESFAPADGALRRLRAYVETPRDRERAASAA